MESGTQLGHYEIGTRLGKGEMVDFMKLETAKCPNCKHEVNEKTLIEPQ